MAVTRLEMRARTPYENGREFGAAGAYERIDGVLHFAVAPHDPLNAAIVDLDRAARGNDGLVHFNADFCLLRPVDPARGNGSLLFEVVNRGNKLAPAFINRAPRTIIADDQIRPGDGFLMRHGWTIAWCGWQWDVHRQPAFLGLDAPQALDDAGRPLQGQVLVRLETVECATDLPLRDGLSVHGAYPAADIHDPEAVLVVRDHPRGPATTIARDQWRFARDVGGRPLGDDTRVWLAGGFQPGKLYEVVYRTRICPVVGTGLLAVRDCVAFLRHGTAAASNPVAGTVRQTFGYGASQSGRFLRTFVYHGLNLDEQRRHVFDGLLVDIAGGLRGQFNHRYAQPSDAFTRGLGHLPPFTDDDQSGAEAGSISGLLHRARATGSVPRIFYTNTSAEYWRGDASLIHTNAAGDADIELPSESRSYLFAGTQHGGGMLPLTRHNPLTGNRGANLFNIVDYRPLLRAALENLRQWVVDGVEPPASRIPRLADNAAMTAEEAAERFRKLAIAPAPASEFVPTLTRLDLGPDAGKGIARVPGISGKPWQTYVAAVDDDGNEVAGVRMPDLAVPLATYTGWNPNDGEGGADGQILRLVGSTIPFAATDAERGDDPRPSIASRYRDRDDYLVRVRAAAEQLVAERFLLAEDLDYAVQLAAERYDLFSKTPVLT